MLLLIMDREESVVVPAEQVSLDPKWTLAPGMPVPEGWEKVTATITEASDDSVRIP